MQKLYDSEAFVVVHMVVNAEEIEKYHEDQLRNPWRRARPSARHAFEIVDKRTNRELLLDGPWSEIFQGVIDGWQRNEPDQDEVEETLDRFCSLAQIPLVLH